MHCIIINTGNKLTNIEAYIINQLNPQKINSFIDHKTHWLDQLDKTNIAKNAAHHIVPPADPVVSLSGIISGVIGEKLQAAGPILSIVTNKLGAASQSGAHKGFNFGALISGGPGHATHGAAI